MTARRGARALRFRAEGLRGVRWPSGGAALVGSLACTLAVVLALPGRLLAHDVDVTSVARVFLEQVGERRYAFSVVDAKVPPITDASGVLPDGCTALPADPASLWIPSGFAFECAEPLTLDDQIRLPWSLAGVVVLASWSDGTRASAYFRGDGRAVRVRLSDLRAGAGPGWGLSRRYFGLGVGHILLGIDHLLFVLGLLVLVRGAVPLVKTITAFTVAHSVTLGAAVLGYLPFGRAPVEAAIALSIALLAREIVTGGRGERHLVHRRPWVVAFVFGLLHGLGFAGALGEIGLHAADIPLALLFFNLGVEAGQLAFVLVVVALYRSARGVLRPALPRLEPALGYALGALAMLWFLDRLPALWGV